MQPQAVTLTCLTLPHFVMSMPLPHLPCHEDSSAQDVTTRKSKLTFVETSNCISRFSHHISHISVKKALEIHVTIKLYEFHTTHAAKPFFFLYTRNCSNAMLMTKFFLSPTSCYLTSFFHVITHSYITTVGRTPLDEGSARRRDFNLTTHNTHNRQIYTPPAGFEPTILAGDRLQAHALNRLATGIGLTTKYAP